MFSSVLNEIDYFSDYLRANAADAGNDIAALDRSTLTGFAHTLRPSSSWAPNDTAHGGTETCLPWNNPCSTSAS